MAKATKTSEVYTDKNGHKIVEPIYHGAGCVGGMMGLTENK